MLLHTLWALMLLHTFFSIVIGSMALLAMDVGRPAPSLPLAKRPDTAAVTRFERFVIVMISSFRL